MCAPRVLTRPAHCTIMRRQLPDASVVFRLRDLIYNPSAMAIVPTGGAFDTLLLNTLREHSSVSGARRTLPADAVVSRFLEAAGWLLVQLLQTRNVWVLGLDPPREGDYRDSIVSSTIFPSRSSEKFVGLPVPEIRSRGEHWFSFVPSYAHNRVVASRYGLALLKAPVLQPVAGEAAALLDHAARSIGSALAVLEEALPLRDAVRAISQPNLLTRLADDYLGYELLRAAKDVGDWKSLSYWRSSRGGGPIEKLAEENADRSALEPGEFSGGHVAALLAERPDCSVIVVEHAAAPSRRPADIIAAITGDAGTVERDLVIEGLASTPTVLRVVLPPSRESTSEEVWLKIRTLCSILLTHLRKKSAATRDEGIDHRLGPQDVLCLLPFVHDRPKPEAPGEAVLVCVIGPSFVRPLQFPRIRRVCDYSLVTLDSLGRMHERIEAWTNVVTRFHNVAAAGEFFDALEDVARLLDATGVIWWERTPGLATPTYFTPDVFAEVDLTALPEDVRLDDPSPLFFGHVHPGRQAWLTRVERKLVSARILPHGRRPQRESVSGFLVPIRTGDADHLLAIIRDRISRRRRMDLAFLNSLQLIVTQAAARVWSNRPAVIDISRSRLRQCSADEFADEVAEVLKGATNSDTSLLLYVDSDAECLSTAAHVHGAKIADADGLLTQSRGTVADRCLSLNTVLYAQVSGRRAAVFRVGAGGRLEPAGDADYVGWMPAVVSAMAVPLRVAGRPYAIGLVGWRTELSEDKRAEAYRSLRSIAETVTDIASQRLRENDARLRDALQPAFSELRRVAEPMLVSPPPHAGWLPPEIEQLFPDEFQQALGVLLDRVVREIPCLSATVRLLDRSGTRLFLVAGGGRPAAATIYALDPVESVSAYCVKHFSTRPAISLPRVHRNKEEMARRYNARYPGLVYAAARAETRAQLCLPLTSRNSNRPFGTINFESDTDNGLHSTRRYCDELRDDLQDLMDRRLAWSRSELLRHVTYMGYLFSQEHHNLKDLLTIAEQRVLDGRMPNDVRERVTDVFNGQRALIQARIGELRSLHENAAFNIAETVRLVAKRVFTQSIIQSQLDIEDCGDARGNRWLFGRAVESTLMQLLAYLRYHDVGRAPAATVRVILRRRPAEHGSVLALAHDGPPLDERLEDLLFWYQITQYSDTGSGMGLALTGFEFRSMNMYPRASRNPPGFLEPPSETWRTWFTIHIPSGSE